MAAPKRRIAGIAASIPAGYVLGRTQGGEGDIGLISISDLGQSMVASGAVMSGGGGPAVTIAAGTGIGVAGGPAYTISNTGVLSIAAPAAGFTVNAATGAITFTLADDLAALEALSSTGMAARTGASTWATRTITASTGISVSNGDGVAGNPTITNTGVTSIVAGTNVTISGATGAVTVNAPNAGSGNYLGRRILTGSGTYTPTTGTASIILTMVGGGGAGGGVPATSSTQQSEGSGGGAGALIQTYLTSGFISASYGVGAAGASSSGAAGGNGGDTTFGTRTAGGGTGGAVGLLTNTPVAGSLGGVVSGNVAGDIAFAGMRGWYSSPVLNGGDAVSGRGADAPLGFGFGGSETIGSAAGVSMTGFGAGGGGAANLASQSARAGGQGGAGTIVIDEYGPSAAASISVKYIIGSAVMSGVLTNSQKLLYHRVTKAVTFPANFGAYLGHTSEAGGSANATASTVINVDKAPTATPNTFSNVGTITIAAGSVTPTFATSGGTTVSFAQGDVLRIIGPSSADATLADFYATLVGFET